MGGGRGEVVYCGREGSLGVVIGFGGGHVGDYRLWRWVGRGYEVSV